MDGELTQREERELRRHVRACAECAREQAEVSNLRDVMAVWTDEEPSAWLAQNFAYRLQDEMVRKPARRTSRQRRVFGTAAAGLATALLAFGIILHSQMVPQVPVPSEPTTVVQQDEPAASGNRVAASEKPKLDRPVPPPTAGIRQPATPQTTPGVVRQQTPRAVPPQTAGRTPAPDRTRSATPAVVKTGPAPLTGRVATAPRTNLVRTRPEPIDRGSTGRDAEVKRMVLRNIALASRAEGNAESTVAGQLARADMTMNQSVEEVRGVIRKAVDVLARSEDQVEPITMTSF